MTDSAKSITPLFNMNVVVKETGLNPDVIRAWERRYSLPNPNRSSGGHRLYSRQDIETVKWLQSRQAQGMSIRRATDLWKELIAAGHDPISEFKHVNPVVMNLSATENVQLDGMRSKWLEACLGFNRVLSDDILNEASARFPIESICIELFQKGLSEIGKRWYHGSVTVQQEHFVSAQVLRHMEVLINATPDPSREQSIMIGCPPGELHTYPSLFLSLMLRRKGYKVIDLGADIPFEQMQETISTIKPDLVVMSAQQLTTAAAILAAARQLHDWGVIFAYGGLIFNQIPSLRKHIPAVYLGESLAGARLLIDSLLAGATHVTDYEPDTDDHYELSRLYQEKRPCIELAMFDNLEKLDVSVKDINDINSYFGNRLFTAITFGQPALVELDMDWLIGLTSNRQVPVEILSRYLISYSQAVRFEVGDKGKKISSWIESYATKLEHHNNRR